jgi:hypothetical protein
MKSYIYILSFLLFSATVGLGQQYQRMQISAPDLNNISISANGNPVTIKAHCLDQARKVPTSKVSLSNILNNPQNVKIEFTDNGETKPLSEVLAKGKNNGIEVTGSDDYSEEELFNEFLNALMSGKEPSLTLKVKIKNNTNRPIRFICKGDLQLGELAEPSVQTYGATEQDEIWVNTSLIKFNELGYISNSDFENSLKNTDISEKKKKLKQIVKNFESDKKLEPTGDLHSKITQSKFNEVYNKYLAEKVRQDKIVKDLFKTFDLGINGKTAYDLRKNYEAAAGITEDISWEELKKKIKKDYDENLYFLYDKSSNSYIKYLKSKKINGLLIKISDYVKRNFAALEDNLFANKIDQSKVHILNFLSKTEDDETFKTLRRLFPNNHSDFSVTEIGKLKQKIKANGVKYMFCFGHYKKAKIFTTVNGKTIEYDIDLLYKIGDQLNVEMFFIGCESSLATGGGTGTTINVNSIRILNSLFESLNSSESLGGFFTAFTSKGEKKYNFSYEFEETTGIVRVFVYERAESEFGNSYHDDTKPKIVFSFPPYFFSGIINQNNNDDDKQ